MPAKDRPTCVTVGSRTKTESTIANLFHLGFGNCVRARGAAARGVSSTPRIAASASASCSASRQTASVVLVCNTERTSAADAKDAKERRLLLTAAVRMFGVAAIAKTTPVAISGLFSSLFQPALASAADTSSTLTWLPGPASAFTLTRSSERPRPRAIANVPAYCDFVGPTTSTTDEPRGSHKRWVRPAPSDAVSVVLT